MFPNTPVLPSLPTQLPCFLIPPPIPGQEGKLLEGRGRLCSHLNVQWELESSNWTELKNQP